MRHIYLLSLGILLTLTESTAIDCLDGQERIGTGRNANCKDKNECESEPLICGENAKCFNTNGSYYCQCQEGFTPTHNFTAMDGTECKDINECVDQSIDCGPNANCVNAEGGYSCTCEPGYISSNGKEMFSAGQGIQCIDRDVCTDPSICGINATCHNTYSNFYCICAAGFRLKSGETNFTDPNESCMSVCDIDKSICGEGGVCHNSKDGHECVCRSGFTNYGHKQMKCTELKCNTIISESKASQASPELTKLVSFMNNNCLALKKSESVSFKQGGGERLLEAFLSALDSLLDGGFQGGNHEVSAMFNIVERMLKLIGPLLSESQTKRSSNKTEVELLVKWGKSPPEGDFNISSSRTQFTSHWDTATGNTYLGFTTAALLSYKGLEESLNRYFNHLETRKKQTFKINSKVVTATVSNTETDNLQKPVNLTFSHLENTNETHICVFWDPKLKGGAWSKEGCTRVNSNDVQTVCSCTHLSSFAVLMALYDIGDVYELTLITWVGLPLSLVCLLICIITFYLVRSIQSTRNTIHLHLCISLFIAYFVFLVGITRTENEVGCAVVAGVLHYFFLASFCWMCLEGVQLFRMVVLVFNTTLRPIYMIAAGYGVPAVIVAISATVNASGYGTPGYCWLNIQDGFIWSFYGPVCAIIIVNVFFFLITIWKLAEKFSSLNPDLNNLHKIKAFTVTAIAQLCVLGIMWVFGCFQFNKDTLAMSYIFTILSSLQGVLMFILHCWLSKQVRDEYAKFLSSICTPQKRKYSEFSSNQTSKSQGSKSAQHTGESHI
ncbi:adhesion G protein-coupled receptor E5 isoform X3 [Ctenopharyngodon idella]|uniref:adhesion G protein-coupled receptor E5 isoform X3 n=1 Tax=Ctenopharyngodon idella TaxID=7959 RepID=UPI002230FED2|nr:adhesion G protein-coupled receptor E5 isoform X3 [Ctenopharyngodon idella]